MFLREIFLPLVFFSPVSQEMPDGAGAWTSPSLQNYPLKRPPALTPNFASSPAAKRMSLAMPHLRRQASLQTTSVVLQTRGGSEPLREVCASLDITSGWPSRAGCDRRQSAKRTLTLTAPESPWRDAGWRRSGQVVPWPATLRLDEAHTECAAGPPPTPHFCKVAMFLVAGPSRIMTYGADQVCKQGVLFCKLASLTNLTADDPVARSV